MRPGIEPATSWRLCRVLNPPRHNGNAYIIFKSKDFGIKQTQIQTLTWPLINWVALSKSRPFLSLSMKAGPCPLLHLDPCRLPSPRFQLPANAPQRFPPQVFTAAVPSALPPALPVARSSHLSCQLESHLLQEAKSPPSQVTGPPEDIFAPPTASSPFGPTVHHVSRVCWIE